MPIDGTESMSRLPRSNGDGGWVLEPDMLMKVAHSIQREHGWDTCMEVVELAMIEAEKMLSSKEQDRDDS